MTQSEADSATTDVEEAAENNTEAPKTSNPSPSTPPPPPSARFKAWLGHLIHTWDGRGLVLAVLIPAIYYLIMVPVEITFGDGPELLTTVYHLGVIHPSGY
ncbi:MAG: hypothetical protein AAFS10_05925, partial [Myxococcota bacterium]